MTAAGVGRALTRVRRAHEKEDVSVNDFLDLIANWSRSLNFENSTSGLAYETMNNMPGKHSTTNI